MAFWNDPFFSDPWAEMKRMQREMDTLFGFNQRQQQQQRLEGGSGSNSSALTTTSSFNNNLWRPLCDVKETDKELLVHAELPGVKKEDIHIELQNGILTISGERKEEKKEEKEKYHRVERNYGRFARSVAVPEGVTEDQVKAKIENGVLEVAIPKPPAKPAPKQIPIQ